MLFRSLVKYFMPQYTEGIFPAQIICVGVAFYGTTMLYGNIFSVLKENRRLLLSTILLCASNIILSVSIVIAFGFRLSYVAIGTSVSYVIYSLILITILTKRYSVGLFDIIKKTWGPVFITLLPNVVIYSLILNPTLKLIWAFIFLGVEVALFQKIGRRYVV